MSHSVHACLPEDSIEAALNVMKQFKVRRLPVIDENGILHGIVSINDLVRAASAGKQVALKEVVSAMARICEPRALNVA
jgi:CBS domain-containing protein